MLVKLDIAGDGVTLGRPEHVWETSRLRFCPLGLTGCVWTAPISGRDAACRVSAAAGDGASPVSTSARWPSSACVRCFCRPRLRYYLLQHETRSHFLVPNSAEGESEEVRGGRRGQDRRREGSRSFGQRRTCDCDRSASGGLDSVASPCRQTDLAPPPLPARGRGTRFPGDRGHELQRDQRCGIPSVC